MLPQKTHHNISVGSEKDIGKLKDQFFFVRIITYRNVRMIKSSQFENTYIHSFINSFIHFLVFIILFLQFYIPIFCGSSLITLICLLQRMGEENLPESSFSLSSPY